ERESGQRGYRDAETNANQQTPRTGSAMHTTPCQQTRTNTGPRYSRNEEPHKTVALGDGHEFPFGRVGLQTTFKEAGPLHPTSISRNSYSDSKCQDNPGAGVGTRLFTFRVPCNEPPGCSPGHSCKNASVHCAEPGTSADRPRHAPKRREHQRG